MKKLVLAAICISFFACANSKKTTKEIANSQANVAASKTHFTVSFISIGAGPDTKARMAYDQYIAAFEQKNKVQLSVEKVNWGREGETDYCFDLNNLNNKQQTIFVAESKAKLSESKLIRFSQKMTCREPRK